MPRAATGARFHASATRCSGLSERPSRQVGSRTRTGSISPVGENLLLADRFQLWWTPQILPAAPPPTSSITLSANFFEQLVAAPVPLDLRAVRVLKQSPLALDLYAWATRRVSYLERPTLISWEALRRSFGAGYC